MLRGHQRRHTRDGRVARRVNASGTIRFDAERTHMVEPFDQGFKIAGAGRFGPLAYPGQAGAIIVGGHDKPVQCVGLRWRQFTDQVRKSGAARLRPRDQRHTLQRRGRGQNDARGPKMIDHGGDDRFATIGRRCGIDAEPQHRAEIAAIECAQPKPRFDLGAMLAQRRFARGIGGELVGFTADLTREQSIQRGRWTFTGRERPAWPPQITELDGIAETIGTATAAQHLGEVVWSQCVEALDRGKVSRRVEQRGALQGRQNGFGAHRPHAGTGRHIICCAEAWRSIDGDTGLVT